MEKSLTATPDAPSLPEIVSAALQLVRDSGHPAITDLLESAEARLARQDVLVAVLGEFKQGKSSLINGLLGETVLTVDDDLATAVPAIVRFGPARSLRARRRSDDGPVSDELPFDALTEVGSERGAAVSRAGIEALEIELPNRFLEHGLVLVDTPGFGSLRDGYDDLTLAALRTADGALFVTDASAPLSSAEATFLGRAVAAASAVVLVVTKSDLYAETERILQANEEILAARGLRVPMAAVSTALRVEAFARNDGELNNLSGYPELLSAIHTTMLAAPGQAAKGRAERETSSALGALIASLEGEAAVLRDPSSAGESVRKLNEAQSRLERLRGPGARWSQIIGDGYSDLLSEVDYHFRASLRDALRIAEEAIEASDPKESWERITQDVRIALGSAVGAIVTELETGAGRVDGQAAEVLEAESVTGPEGAGAPMDVDSLWRASLNDSAMLKELGGTAFSGLRGAQGGIIMFGLLTNLAGLALTTGATLGIGAVFGGKQIMDERRRQVTARRQQARQAVRQFVDDVQFEASKSLRDLGRDLQRRARDHFVGHINATSEELTASIERVRSAANAEEGVRRRELTSAETRIGAARELLSLLPATGRP